MCVRTVCRGCNDSKIVSCGYTTTDTHGNPDRNYRCEPQTSRNKCETCIIIEGVIQQLRVLVVRYPFLETEGYGALNAMADWQYDKDLVKPSPSDEYTAIMERDDEYLQARLQDMGLSDMEGTENFWEGEGLGRPTKDEKSDEMTSENTCSSHATSQSTQDVAREGVEETICLTDHAKSV